MNKMHRIILVLGILAMAGHAQQNGATFPARVRMAPPCSAAILAVFSFE
jgi:hypothetical protein